MPHITIEYSANVADHHNIDALVDTVHEAALVHGLPALPGLRTRAVARENYRIADGDPTFAFVAIHCRIAPGRPQEVKTTFLEDVLAAAEKQLDSEDGTLQVAWAIEITEMNPELRINHNRVRSAIENR